MPYNETFIQWLDRLEIPWEKVKNVPGNEDYDCLVVRWKDLAAGQRRDQQDGCDGGLVMFGEPGKVVAGEAGEPGEDEGQAEVFRLRILNAELYRVCKKFVSDLLHSLENYPEGSFERAKALRLLVANAKVNLHSLEKQL